MVLVPVFLKRKRQGSGAPAISGLAICCCCCSAPFRPWRNRDPIVFCCEKPTCPCLPPTTPKQWRRGFRARPTTILPVWAFCGRWMSCAACVELETPDWRSPACAISRARYLSHYLRGVPWPKPRMCPWLELMCAKCWHRHTLSGPHLGCVMGTNTLVNPARIRQ